MCKERVAEVLKRLELYSGPMKECPVPLDILETNNKALELISQARVFISVYINNKKKLYKFIYKRLYIFI